MERDYLPLPIILWWLFGTFRGSLSYFVVPELTPPTYQNWVMVDIFAL